MRWYAGYCRCGKHYYRYDNNAVVYGDERCRYCFEEIRINKNDYKEEK